MKPAFTSNAPSNLRELCHSLMKRSPVPVAELEGPDHIMRYVNPAFCHLVDKNKEALIDKPFPETVPTGDWCLALLDRVYRTGEAETHTEREESELRPAFWSYAMWPILAQDEHPVGVMLQVTESTQFHQQAAEMAEMNEALLLSSMRQHELTAAAEKLNDQLQTQIKALRQAEQREQELRAAAEESNRLKDEFLAIMSHELRNPLNVMLGYSDVLARSEEIKAAPQLERIAQAIKRNAMAQSKLIRDVLDLSRLRSGKLQLNMETVSIAAVVNHALETVAEDAEAKQIVIDINAPDEALFVHGDPLRLEQIVWNLLNNSVKFTPSGGRITLQVSKADEQMEIKILDTGQGIAPSFLPHIFELFRQEDASFTRVQSGMGIGLAIVQQLVHLHHGSIEAASSGPGTGATFTVKLPLSVQIEATIEHRRSELNLIDISILVIDDSEDTVEMLKRLLQMSGAAVTGATSADEGLLYARDKHFDVVLSDISMPGMDGFEFLRRLRQLPGKANIPVLALTGFGRPEDVEHARAAGFFAHVIKPIDLESLTRVLQIFRKKRDNQ
ncbi:MAG TPA: ATP-binding protein [Pyrinomonadaceae bacterium]|nr:ATP-binding protein [Pyrinomonadaceae bacterium]